MGTEALEDRIGALEAALDATRHELGELVRALRESPPETVPADGAAVPLDGANGEAQPEEGDPSWRALYERLPDPLLTVDGEGRVLACNRTGLRWLGADADAVVGRPLAELFAEESRSELQAVAAADWAWAGERRFVLTDGRVVGLNAVAAAATGARRFHVTLHDLTARHVLDEAAVQRRRMESLADLAGAIARELNDPMSIVQGRLELLLELGVEDPDLVRRHLEVALEHARRISATLRNLRLVGRTVVPRTEAISLRSAVEEALELVGPRARAVQVDLQPPDVAATGETAMYARVLASLLRRALEHAPRQGNVELKGRYDQGHVTVRISVRGRLRDPNEALAASGFSIDETLLAGVGGRLRIEGGPTELIYTVTLPPPPRRRVRARPVEEHLVVVGSDEFRRTVEALLAREGFSIRGVRTGEAALQVLEEDGQTHGVVAELLLDGMSGLGLADVIARQHPDLEQRVVLVSHSRLDNAPSHVVALAEPLRRRPLLEALGRRVR